MSDLRFRFATTDDIPAVVDLVQSAYRGERSRAGWTTEADLISGQRVDAAMVSATLAKPHSFVLLAETDQIVGCCELTTHHARPDTSYFGMFAVAPTSQSQGIGTAILDEAERVSIEVLHATAIELVTIHLRDDVISMYERRGFAQTGETIPFPYGDDRYGTPRRDDLYLVALRKPLVEIPNP